MCCVCVFVVWEVDMGVVWMDVDVYVACCGVCICVCVCVVLCVCSGCGWMCLLCCVFVLGVGGCVCVCVSSMPFGSPLTEFSSYMCCVCGGNLCVSVYVYVCCVWYVCAYVCCLYLCVCVCVVCVYVCMLCVDVYFGRQEGEPRLKKDKQTRAPNSWSQQEKANSASFSSFACFHAKKRANSAPFSWFLVCSTFQEKTNSISPPFFSSLPLFSLLSFFFFRSPPVQLVVAA